MKLLFLPLSLLLIVLGHMLLHNLYINVLIALILVYRNSLWDLQGPKYRNLAFDRSGGEDQKNGFSQISQLLFVLGHMLLHNSYMNVLIAFLRCIRIVCRTFLDWNAKIHSKSNLAYERNHFLHMTKKSRKYCSAHDLIFTKFFISAQVSLCRLQSNIDLKISKFRII